MNFRLNAILAGAFLAVAGSANAALDQMDNINGSGSSLAFVAYDRTGSAVGSFMADLGYNLTSFLPSSTVNTAGTVITWNFNTDAITVTGNSNAAAQPVGNVAFADAYAAFKSTVQTGELRWAVIAGDSNLQQFITTGNPTTGNLADTGTTRQTNQSTASMVNVNDMLAAANLSSGTHATADNGANFSVPGETAYFARTAAGQFGNNGNWNSALKWNAVSLNGATSRLFFIDNVPRAGVGDTAEIVTYGLGNPSAPGTLTADFSHFSFDMNTDTLTWTGMAAPVPEASTLAMLLAGLGGVGFIARRRRAA